MTPEDEIREIEEEIRKTPYHKGTQGHIGRLKAKLARLRFDQEKRAGGGPKGLGYAIRKSGDATILLVGFPSVGKSTLLNRLTNAESKVGEYDFTTIDVIPGMLDYKGAKIQILDIPGLVEGAASGKGRGKEILSVVRNADLVLIMADVKKPGQAGVIKKEFYNAGFRLNQKRPDIKIEKINTGGLKIGSTIKLKKISPEEIKSILQEFKILNADVLIREDITADQLIDCIMKNRIYAPALIVLNKIDLGGKPAPGKNTIVISAKNGTGIEELKRMVWKKLNLMRIYMKRAGKEADLKEPFIFRKGSTVRDVCNRIHGELAKDFSFARVWGPTARFPGQKVGLNHILRDRDIVELHK
jgi:small GTP-binding protein